MLNRLLLYAILAAAIVLAASGCGPSDAVNAHKVMGQAVTDYHNDADKYVEKLLAKLRESEEACASVVMQYELTKVANTQDNVPLEAVQQLELQRQAARRANDAAVDQLRSEWRALQVNYVNAMRVWEALARQYSIVETFVGDWINVGTN